MALSAVSYLLNIIVSFTKQHTIYIQYIKNQFFNGFKTNTLLYWLVYFYEM